MSSRSFIKHFFLPSWGSLTVLTLTLFMLVSSCSKDSTVPIPEPREMEVWLHRVNSVGKAHHFQDNYTGFELDVHYDTVLKTFIVKHDFADTTTLTWQAWLGSIDHPERLGYWLDFKNLSTANNSAALAELIRIRNSFGLTLHPIVVESTDSPSLPPFDTLNFLISYYIPWFDPAAITSAEELYYQDFIRKQVDQYEIPTISGYYSQHDFMMKWFPEMNKLSWYLDSFDAAKKDSIIALARKDPTIEVFLVAEDYP